MSEPEETATLDAAIEDIGPCKKRVSITIPGDRVSEEIEKQYADIIQNYNFKGFRKGKVPRRLVEKQLGDSILGEVRQNLMQDSFEKALEEHELTPLGEPDLGDENELEVEAGKPLSFSIEFEVRPTFDLPDIKKLKAERVVEPVTDAMVDESLERLAKQRGTYAPCEDFGSIRPDDLVKAETALLQNDETVLHHDDFSVVPGEKRLYGFRVDDLADRLADAELGKSVEFEIEVPEYLAGGRSHLTEGAATIRLTPRSVERMEVPAIDDEFAKTLDFDSLDDLREDIRKHGALEQERAADRKVEESLLDSLVEATPFDVPEGIVDQQLEYSVERERIRMQIEGVPNLEIEEKLDLSRGKQRDDIVLGMKKAFLLEKVAKQEKIFVTEEMVYATVQAMAQQQGRDPQELLNELAERRQLADLRTELRERITRETLRKKAEVSDNQADNED